MKIVVCVRQSVSGEINPFDACAYEAALQTENAEVILLSMGPIMVKDFLLSLTRLGAKKAILLCDKAFAGADTLATAYTLSLAIKKLSPDLVICGRQTVDGDTGQTGPEIAINAGRDLVTNVMSINNTVHVLSCTTRDGENKTVSYPALITIERINNLRLPSIRSKVGEVEVWDAAAINADLSRCGLNGSPTRVIKTFENEQDRRNCKFIKPEELPGIIEASLKKDRRNLITEPSNGKKLENVWIVEESPRHMAATISDDITVVPLQEPLKMAELINLKKPDVVLWGSDSKSKEIAPQVAALLKTGLCADCTRLETDGEELFMYRPAFSGNIIAKIRCITRPQMATVRTAEQKTANLIVGIGFGARDEITELTKLAEKYGGKIAATRKMVDNGFLPYSLQVGLTGKTVAPSVYLAVGISGAVHHIAGIRQSGTIIAVNSDKDAPIFKYADYGTIVY